MHVHLLHKADQPGIERTIESFDALGASVTPLVSESSEQISSLIEDAQPERLVVSGGDGMIHHAVQAITAPLTMSTTPVLGIIPAGTGNDIARAFGVSKRPSESAAIALRAPTPTDLIRVTDQTGNSSWAVSVLTTGFSGTVTERANRMRRLRGQLKYTAATIACLPRLVAYGASGTDLPSDEFSILAFANTRYFGGGMAICPNADPNDGRLDAVLIDAVHPLHLAAVLPAAFIGQHVRSRKVHQWSAKRLTLTTDADWWADGEPLPHSGPVTIEVVPDALRLARST